MKIRVATTNSLQYIKNPCPIMLSQLSTDILQSFSQLSASLSSLSVPKASKAFRFFGLGLGSSCWQLAAAVAFASPPATDAAAVSSNPEPLLAAIESLISCKVFLQLNMIKTGKLSLGCRDTPEERSATLRIHLSRVHAGCILIAQIHCVDVH